MHTVGLQIDDVAWTMGCTETIGYASQYGEVVFNPLALNYTITIDREGVLPSYVISRVTGAVMFNFPTSRHNIKDGYWENISPTQNGYLTLKGTSAPVARVFAVEKLPMADGSYIRVVVAPAVRVLNSSITNSGSTTNYVRMYLPILGVGETPRLSKSITLTGESLDALTISDVVGINVAVSFQDGSDFDSEFFNFPFDSENVSLPSGDVVLELYLSEVSVGFGINY